MIIIHNLMWLSCGGDRPQSDGASEKRCVIVDCVIRSNQSDAIDVTLHCTVTSRLNNIKVAGTGILFHFNEYNFTLVYKSCQTSQWFGYVC